MTEDEIVTETITVYYADGTSQTFSFCSGYTNDGKVVSFTGQLNGEEVNVKHEINWTLVRRIRREPTA